MRAFRAPDLSAATTVVTGAGQGIGAAIARALAAAGAYVVMDGRRATTLMQVCDDINASGGQATFLAGDVTDPEHVEQLMAFASEHTGAIDILVNNAGIAGPTAPLKEVTLEQWNQTIGVNLTGVFLTCRAALPFLERAEHAKIINIGSVTGKRPLVNRTPYAAAKIGVVGLTRSLAHEVGPLGISVNTISPWLVGGARLDNVINSMAAERGITPTELRDELTRDTALKQTVSEYDVANLALFLCSSAADNITGQDFNVSAGGVMF